MRAKLTRDPNAGCAELGDWPSVESGSKWAAFTNAYKYICMHVCVCIYRNMSYGHVGDHFATIDAKFIEFR